MTTFAVAWAAVKLKDPELLSFCLLTAVLDTIAVVAVVFALAWGEP